MKIIILGAGILGVASAWFLNRDGHEVTVIDRQPAAACETSFANGSQISVSYAEPWANPAAPLKILKWLGREDAPLLFRLRADPRQWAWALAFLRQCTPARTRYNTTQLTNLGLYSRATLDSLREELKLPFDHLAKGILHFYDSESEYEAARPGFELMRDLGCRLAFLSADEVIATEPALGAYRSAGNQLAGGVYAPDDESGDAFKFTQELAARATAAGVVFRFGTAIEGLALGEGRIEGAGVAEGDRGVPGPGGRSEMLKADAYVVCLGSWSAPLLRTVGIRTSIYPAKGYSATVPIRSGALATTISLTDHARKLVFSRLGERLRIAGTAELSGYNTELNQARCAALSRRTRQIFPEGLDHSSTTYWTGLRPATPSNIPYIGRSRLANLWLNTGHGTLGWTHGAGSGRALADLIAGRKPEVDFAFYGITGSA